MLTTGREMCIMSIYVNPTLMGMRVKFWRFLSHNLRYLVSDNVGIVFLSLIVLCGNELYVVRIDNRFLQSCSEI